MLPLKLALRHRLVVWKKTRPVAWNIAMKNIDKGTYKVKTRKNILHDLKYAAYLPSHGLMLTKRPMLVVSLQPSAVVNILLPLIKDVPSKLTSRRANITSNAS